MFVTAFLAVYDEATGRIAYANAGHNPPLFLRAASGKVTALARRSLALAILPETRYDDRTITMHDGDMLLLYTDGLTEARGSNGDMYGIERLTEALRRCRALGARQSVDAIVEDVTRWRGGADFLDDLTLVVARREATENPR